MGRRFSLNEEGLNEEGLNEEGETSALPSRSWWKRAKNGFCVAA
jgi:hypothetical protein